MSRLRSWVLGALGACVAGQVSAQDVRWTHYGLRPLGMGNAYVAVADDFNALFYNPAGIARLKTWDGELLNPYAAVSSGLSKLVDEAKDLQGSGSSVSKSLDLLDNNTGKTVYGAAGLTPHLIFPKFGFGIGIEMAASMVFHRYPSIALDVGPRIIAPMAFGMNFLEDRLSIGAGLKYVMRAGVNHDFSIQDIGAFTAKDSDSGSKIDDFVEGGSGVGADVGMLFTPIKPMEPTLGVSITDLGGTPYQAMKISGEKAQSPETRLPSLNLGFSMKPYQGGNSYVMTSVDVHSANQPFSFSKKFNLGVEYGLGSILKIQSGLHQGYFSGGLQIDVGLINLRAVSYTEELGLSTAPENANPNRRYALQLKLLI